MRVSPLETHLPIPAYSSNWSERHVGFITGLGTFGKSTNFISRAGACGRLVSIVTDWETERMRRTTRASMTTAPSAALLQGLPRLRAVEGGEGHHEMHGFPRNCGRKYKPRYGCGKCQSGGPCAMKPQKKQR
jgi:epoxyqueuosine reductase QueG